MAIEHNYLLAQVVRQVFHGLSFPSPGDARRNASQRQVPGADHGDEAFIDQGRENQVRLVSQVFEPVRAGSLKALGS